MTATSRRTLYIFLMAVLTVQVCCWWQLRHVRLEWMNVPPAPGEIGAAGLAIGDTQFAYRTIGLMLQNLGDVGGRSTAFDKYNYEDLIKWFYLSDKMDPRSDFAPYLAAFYYSAANDPHRLSLLVDYLAVMGRNKEGEKWRWLGQAVYIAQYKLKDLDKAYRLAEELAVFDKPDMPAWTKQMPAFILKAQGNKQGAYDVLVEMMKSGKDTLPREEINAMTDYICVQILTPEQASQNPLCQDRK